MPLRKSVVVICIIVLLLSEQLVGREPEDLADRCNVGKKHRQPVDAQRDSSRWWQAPVERPDKIFVDVVRNFSQRAPLALLVAEATMLLGRVSKLAERVRHFDASNV